MQLLRHALPLIALTTSLGGAALADTPAAPAAASPSTHAGHRGGRHGHGFEHLLHQLDLTADQQAQVQSIYAQARPRLQALHETGRATHEALEATAPTDPGYAALLVAAKSGATDRVQLESDLWTQIYAVLTPEQQARIPALLAAERAAHAARRAAWQGGRAAS